MISAPNPEKQNNAAISLLTVETTYFTISPLEEFKGQILLP